LGLGLPKKSIEMHVEGAEQEEDGAEAGAGHMPAGAGHMPAGNQDAIEDMIKQIIGGQGSQGGGVGDIGTISSPSVVQVHPPSVGGKSGMKTHNAPATHLSPKGFLQSAGVRRFSMCFNDGSPGVLRLGTPQAGQALGAVGESHWGVGLEGVSVGETKVPALAQFCSADNMTGNQTTPCAAIPDSGTTVMMGPKTHINSLLTAICDGWERCTQNYTALVAAAAAAGEAAKAEYNINPFELEVPDKVTVLKFLLNDCNTWMSETHGIDELPTIHFHVSGSSNEKQHLSLPAWAYVLESMQEDAHYVYKHLEGVGDIPVGKEATNGTKRKVCSPAFGVMDMTTVKNGPVWILGTPLFYQFTVGYDLHTTPPSMSFTSTEDVPCGSCSNTTALLSRGSQRSLASGSAAGRARQLRRISGPLRLPSIDTSLPL